MKILGMIRDQIVPEANEGKICYTLQRRDYKSTMVVIYDLPNEDWSPDGKRLSETGDAGSKK